MVKNTTVRKKNARKGAAAGRGKTEPLGREIWLDTARQALIEDGTAGRELRFRTNVEDWVTCGPQHALRFEPEARTGGLKPYLHVRRDLWAKVTRTLFFDLVELGEEREVDGRAMFGVVSMGTFFPMAPAEQVREFA